MKFGRQLAAILMTLCVLGCVPALAVETSTPVVDTQILSSDITPYAEETEWKIIERDGRVLMRLWSYTRGIWLTDWIDCGPVPS